MKIIKVHEKAYTLQRMQKPFRNQKMVLTAEYIEANYMLKTKLHRLLDEDDAECYTKSTEEK